MTRIFVLWNNAYSVGIEKIDDQHKNLVNILNQLYESFIDRTVGDKLKDLLDQLTDYTDYHFKTEEELFSDHEYPGSESHIIEHQSFINKINKFKEELNSNKTALTFQLMNFLRNWLLQHISESDQAYAAYFRSKGVNPK